MHARHRSPGNGVKSNSMGMGVTAARISPESSIRGHGMYNLEYRNFNRGLGRGFPKPYPPPQRPRRSDIFMEAGRLAAEYLVSQGLLPHSVLPGKWQNSSSKNQTGDFQEFKSQDRGNLQLPSEARMSALARLGNVVPDAGSGRRRFPDEFNPSGSRSHMRGRRKMGSSRGWGRDSGKNGSWSDKIRFSSDMEGEDEFVSVHHEERSVVSDGGGGGVQKAASSELNLKSANAGDSESELESYEFPSNDAGPKVMSSSDRKGVSLDTDGELNKGSDDSKISHLGTEELKHGTTNHETEEQDTPNFPMQNGAMEGEIVTKNGNDLLRLCCFAKVPTKTRSSLTFRGSKVSAVHINEEEKASNVGHPMGSLVHVEEDLIEESSGNVLKSTIQSSKIAESDTCRSMSVHPVENAVDMDSDSILERAKCLNSQSFSDGSFLYEQESSHGPPGFGRCNSMIKERGEKRAVEHEDNREGTKKPREWPSSPIVQDVEYFHPCNLGKDQSSSKEEGRSSNEQMIDGVDQEKLVDVMFPKDRAEFEGDLKDEKQHFPSSFKICDLNLMEAPDMTENHGGDMVLGFPSILEERKEAQMVVGLSMSNSSSKSDDRDRCLTDAKMVESVRVGNESAKEDVACDTSKGKTDIVYSGLESFPNHLENPADLPDVQDGYGLMISELLGADISNCPSVSTDMAALHTEMGLHNGEVMMAEDDSIYLSLGEIPLSLLGVWEQPSQEYGKPF